jgi:hypothetical protein
MYIGHFSPPLEHNFVGSNLAMVQGFQALYIALLFFVTGLVLCLCVLYLNKCQK